MRHWKIPGKRSNKPEQLTPELLLARREVAAEAIQDVLGKLPNPNLTVRELIQQLLKDIPNDND